MEFFKKRKVKILIIAQIFIFTFLISSAISVQAKTNQSNLTETQLNEQTQMQNADLVAIYNPNASTDIHVDGVIDATEYPETFHSEYTGMNVSMAYNGTQLFIGLSAPTTGYAAVGFNNLGYGMVGADIKAGSVRLNTTTNTQYAIAQDYYAAAYTNPTIDSSDPAHNDVVQVAGVENDAGNGTTTLEMVINMHSRVATDDTQIVPGVDPSTGITADKKLDAGNSYSMLLAWGEGDALSYHIRKEIARLYIAPPTVSKREATHLSMALTGSSDLTKNTTVTATATLTYDNGTGVPNAQVGMYLQSLIADTQLATAVTDTNGTATFNFTFLMEYTGSQQLRARYLGDLSTQKSVSKSEPILYTGSVQTEDAPFLIIPMDMDYIVPWLTGLASVATVAFMWTMFGYVIYTVIYKNAVQPDSKKNGGN